MKVALPAIHHNQAGFETLVRLHTQTKDCFLEDIEINMAAVNWFDADMCAAFGAILYDLGCNANSVQMTNIRANVERILSKNGFLIIRAAKKVSGKRF